MNSLSTSESGAETIILLVDDLLFLPRLEQELRHSGYQPVVATDELQLTRAIGAAPILAIVDLFSQSIDWEGLVRFLKGPQKKGNHIPVLGFGPHVDLDLRERALAAGCEAVVGRGAIVTQLPHLIAKHRWTIEKSPCRKPPPELLLEGIRLFNEGAYYDCHEVIEEAWNAEKDPVRVMYQGILQIGVACHHVQNKNWRGAMKLIERGLPKVQRYGPECMGINLARLAADAEAIRQELLRLGEGWQGDFDEALLPTIEVEVSL